MNDKPDDSGLPAAIADVLPDQDHYWQLWNGGRFAKHGTSPDCSGLLVFALREKAEIFGLTIAEKDEKHDWEPVEVTKEEMLEGFRAYRGICVVDGSRVVVVNSERTW